MFLGHQAHCFGGKVSRFSLELADLSRLASQRVNLRSPPVPCPPALDCKLMLTYPLYVGSGDQARPSHLFSRHFTG